MARFLAVRFGEVANMRPVLSVAGSLAIGLLAFPSLGLSAPQINGVVGDISHGGQVQVSGEAFGVKSPARPYFWAPMDGSINPSSLGVVASWAEVQSMGYAPGEGPAGGGAMKATNSSGVWTGRVDAQGFSWSDPGQKMYIFRKLKHNFSIFEPVNFNWKSWRMWGNINSPSGTPTSVLDSIWNGNVALDHSLESQQNLWPFSDNRAAFGTVGEWNTNEILMQSNTNATGYGNGFWQYITNGVIRGEAPYRSYDGIRHFKLWDSSTNPLLRRNYVVHGVRANHTMNSSDRYWAADVYLDNTWARVLIGNAPTLAESSHREIQIPLTWSPNLVSIQINVRAFPPGSRAYLFIVDENNVPSAGFPLGVPPPAAPKDVRVD